MLSVSGVFDGDTERAIFMSAAYHKTCLAWHNASKSMFDCFDPNSLSPIPLSSI